MLHPNSILLFMTAAYHLSFNNQHNDLLSEENMTVMTPAIFCKLQIFSIKGVQKKGVQLHTLFSLGTNAEKTLALRTKQNQKHYMDTHPDLTRKKHHLSSDSLRMTADLYTNAFLNTPTYTCL